jgi:UDP-glucose 4-epimerase/GDP-4-dehydro-6-deoxy-D-mannose reductase
MKIYVTGATGFIGRHLTKYLEQHNIAVHKARADVTSGVEVKNEIEKVLPDKVIHLAAVVSSPWADEADWYSIDVNVRGTYNVAKYSKKAGADFIYASSTSIYKPTDEIITENSPIGPTTIYNLTKYMGEEVVSNIYGGNALILRFSHIYGPDGDHCSIPMKIIRSSVEGYPAVILASSESVRSYLFIYDLLELILGVLQADLKGTYNVSSEEYMSLGKVSNIIVSKLIERGFEPPRIVWRSEADYMGSHKVSSRKIAEKLNWHPKIKFEEGIDKCIEYFLQ